MCRETGKAVKPSQFPPKFDVKSKRAKRTFPNVNRMHTKLNAKLTTFESESRKEDLQTNGPGIEERREIYIGKNGQLRRESNLFRNGRELGKN